MTGILTGVVRFQDLKRNRAALQLADTDDANTSFVVIRIESGSVDMGDEVIGNLGTAGPVDLFNRTRHDHVHAVVLIEPSTRDRAVSVMKSDDADPQ